MDRDFQNFVGLGPVRDLEIVLGPDPVPASKIVPDPDWSDF